MSIRVRDRVRIAGFRMLEGKFKSAYGKMTLKRFSVGEETYFGYYDVSPVSEDGKVILVCSLDKMDSQVMDIGFIRLADGEYKKLSNTSTWCWQMGCRLQWFDAKTAMFNCLIDGSYGSRIINLNGQIIQEFEFPLYALSPDRKWALTTDFSRLGRLRPGYGYTNLPDTTKWILAPETIGISLCNLEDHSCELLLSISNLLTIEPDPTMDGAEHYVNHLSFSPSGELVLFFHIWNRENRRYVRALVTNLKGEIQFVFPFLNHISHYTWINDEEIVAYATHSSAGQTYYRWKIGSDTPEAFMNNPGLRYDGHPTMLDSSRMLTDTKPSRSNFQRLCIYDWNSGRFEELGRFYMPMQYYAEKRCDLHPRFSRTLNRVIFDSAHEGSRSIYITEVLHD